MRIFVTGHTGFKGSWLVFILNQLGHEIIGYSDQEENGSLFQISNCKDLTDINFKADIRSQESLASALNQTKPDFLIHLAAQSLVKKSHQEPELTYQTNLQGTINVLKEASKCASIRGALIVTTDKVYAPNQKNRRYEESDPLAGIDPYSSSKVLADLFTQDWIKYVNPFPIAIARAGNVIGGGDICTDRLVPEIFKSIKAGYDIELRFPDAVRPWQHVLDCLNGYLAISDNLLKTNQSGIWNIGPDKDSDVAVKHICEKFLTLSNSQLSWKISGESHTAETSFLALNSNKSLSGLDWQIQLGLDDAINWAFKWHQDVQSGLDPGEVTKMQVNEFLRLVSYNSSLRAI